MSTPPVSMADRITRFVAFVPSGCWEWTGGRHPEGYGYLRMGGRSHRAHRVFYAHFVGPIPDGLVLDHLCRNTSCVNPDHLEAVTQAENNRRSRAGEVNRARLLARTHCVNGHEFNEANTRINPRDGKRICRICSRERERGYYAKRKQVVA